MRVVTFVLIVLLAAIQYPLWWGHGGWVPVHDLEGQLARQKRRNVQLKLRNERLEGEVDDLRNGTAAIEERARYELGMVRDDEVFVQFVSPNTPLPPQDRTTATTGSTRGQMSSAPVSVVPEPAARPPRRKSTATNPNRHTVHRPSSAHAR